MEKTFLDLGLDKSLIEGLSKQGINNPTEIQASAIPLMLEKKDVVAKSQTGSGKTLAYLLPLFQMVDTSLRKTQAIILTPTHELASQVQKQSELLTKNTNSDVRSVLIIGGASSERQIEKLKEKPQIVIGSAGRIFDLIKRKKIQAHTVQTIILDEADRLLDSINKDSVLSVIKTTLKERQIAFFSASLPPETIAEAKLILKDDFINLSASDFIPSGIRHIYFVLELRDKISTIRKIVHGEKAQQTIVFINNTENIQVTVEKLNFHGLQAIGIYGNMPPYARKAALDSFRNGKAQILVSSDLSARGLDIFGVSHIINLDIPENPVFYQHRAGRCGRAGANGTVISLVTEYEKKFISKYEKQLNLKFDNMQMYKGEMVAFDMVKKPAYSSKPKIKKSNSKK